MYTSQSLNSQLVNIILTVTPLLTALHPQIYCNYSHKKMPVSGIPGQAKIHICPIKHFITHAYVHTTNKHVTTHTHAHTELSSCHVFPMSGTQWKSHSLPNLVHFEIQTRSQTHWHCNHPNVFTCTSISHQIYTAFYTPQSLNLLELQSHIRFTWHSTHHNQIISTAKWCQQVVCRNPPNIKQGEVPW